MSNLLVLASTSHAKLPVPQSEHRQRPPHSDEQPAGPVRTHSLVRHRLRNLHGTRTDDFRVDRLLRLGSHFFAEALESAGPEITLTSYQGRSLLPGRTFAARRTFAASTPKIDSGGCPPLRSRQAAKSRSASGIYFSAAGLLFGKS